jgi:hypothetical protein
MHTGYLVDRDIPVLFFYLLPSPFKRRPTINLVSRDTSKTESRWSPVIADVQADGGTARFQLPDEVTTIHKEDKRGPYVQFDSIQEQSSA